jgi:hypothetical protein
VKHGGMVVSRPFLTIFDTFAKELAGFYIPVRD